MRTALHRRARPATASPTARVAPIDALPAPRVAQPAPMHDISGVAIGETAQRKAATGTNGAAYRAPNRTGLPDRLKGGIEALSGMSMDHVRVHRGSSEPARIGALAHARGADIHLGPGQERHLPHEAWHVVQQAQGRVRPTMQLKRGDALNDDSALEREADAMGGLALRTTRAPVQPTALPPAMNAPRPRSSPVVQAYRIEKSSKRDEQLRSQSPTPEIQPANNVVLPHTPTKIAYPRQQTASGDADFRVANDVSMAVQDTVNEPKEFFAKNAVFENSNTMLEEAGSPLRLKKAGGDVRFGATTLPKIRPENAEAPDNAEFASLWSDICIEIANRIMGNDGAWTEDVVLQSGKLQSSATITADQAISPGIDRLAKYLSDQGSSSISFNAGLNAIKPDDLKERPGQAYGLATARGLRSKSKKLGVNAFASPEVGEGFATFSVFSKENDNTAADYTTGERREGQDTWGYHHAAVVARSLDGKDWMTLENYNRTPQIKDEGYQYLLEKYTEDATRKREELAGQRKTETQIAQDLRYYLMAEYETAFLDYQTVLQESDFDGPALWFFRMYGSEAGQSFHEQQAASGGYVNPLTVRIRKNVVGRHLEKLAANERRVLASIATGRISWAPARAALDTLHTDTTQAFTAMRSTLDGLKDRRTDDQLTTAVQQVDATYTTWLTNSFVPQMATALHATKRGTLGPRPTTLDGLKAQAGSPETQTAFYGAASGVGDWLNDRSPLRSNASADRLTSLTNLRAAIDNVPRKAV